MIHATLHLANAGNPLFFHCWYIIADIVPSNKLSSILKSFHPGYNIPQICLHVIIAVNGKTICDIHPLHAALWLLHTFLGGHDEPEARSIIQHAFSTNLSRWLASSMAYITAHVDEFNSDDKRLMSSVCGILEYCAKFFCSGMEYGHGYVVEALDLRILVSMTKTAHLRVFSDIGGQDGDSNPHAFGTMIYFAE
ncbi:hypothetical protein MPER_01959 [Moniliophthora perniciosa FA553]|nr:hypothetical protein MPER_01959 [Moniliophthora perniciosa FA553]